MGTSPRMASPFTTLKGDILLASSRDDTLRSSNRGPGAYFATDDTFSVTSSLTSPLRRKSYNVRAQNGNLIGHQTAMKQSNSQDDSVFHSPIKSKSTKKPVKNAWTSQETPQTRIAYFTPKTAATSENSVVQTPSNNHHTKRDTPYRNGSQNIRQNEKINGKHPPHIPHGFQTPIH